MISRLEIYRSEKNWESIDPFSSNKMVEMAEIDVITNISYLQEVF